MNKKKKRYKDIHGTTRVGDFLRTIGKFKVLDVIEEIATGDITGAIKVITSSNELTPEQKKQALELAELDLKEDIEITNRWGNDMGSDSWLSKNIRPLVLGYLIIATTVFIILESSILGFEVDKSWVDLLKTIDVSVIVAYFGSRGFEKAKNLINKR